MATARVAAAATYAPTAARLSRHWPTNMEARAIQVRGWSPSCSLPGARLVVGMARSILPARGRSAAAELGPERH